MRIPDPKANTTTEAYLAYKAGYLEESELKPVLYEPYLHFDAWLAYWAGLVPIYPIKAPGKNLFNRNDIAIGSNWSGAINSICYPFRLVDTRRALYLLPVKPNTKYTVSLASSDWYVMEIIDVDSNFTVLSKSKTTAENAFTQTITTGEHFAFLGFKFKYGSAGTTTITKEMLSELKLQVELGDTATSYEDYTGEPEMLTDEEALVAYLSGVTDTYPEEIKDPYDVRIVGYLKHLVSVRWPEPEYPVNNEEFYLSTMKPAVVTNDTPSADIELDDTAEAPFMDLKVYGDTYQQTYSGKNLFNFPGLDKSTANYISANATLVEVLDNGVILKGNTSESTEPAAFSKGAYRPMWNDPNTPLRIPLTSGQKATISADVTLLELGYEAVMSVGYYIGTTDKGKIGEFNLTLNTTVRVFGTITANADGEYSPYFTLASNKVKIENVQVEYGDTVTPFEPYVGGTPSPNPDYPQDINVVTGEQTVKVNGKNLLVISNGRRTENGITWTRNGNTFVGSGTKTGTSNWSAMTAFIDFSTPLPAGTYTLSIKSPVQKAIEFVIRDSSNVNVIAPRISVGRTSVTFTTTREASNFRVVSLDMTSGETLTDYTVSEFQLEAGSVATSFELPQWHTLSLGSTELCKIDSYQDYIYRDADGDWFVHKEVGKSVFDGDEDWTVTSSSVYPYRIAISDINMGIISQSFAPKVLTNLYLSSKWTFDDPLDRPDYCVSATPNSSTLCFRNIDIATLDDFKASIATNNLSVYYILSTPTDTKITDSTLVEQLDALMEGGSYEGKTYIKVTATDPNLPALLKVEAGKYD